MNVARTLGLILLSAAAGALVPYCFFFGIESALIGNRRWDPGLYTLALSGFWVLSWFAVAWVMFTSLPQLTWHWKKLGRLFLVALGIGLASSALCFSLFQAFASNGGLINIVLVLGALALGLFGLTVAFAYGARRIFGVHEPLAQLRFLLISSLIFWLLAGFSPAATFILAILLLNLFGAAVLALPVPVVLLTYFALGKIIATDLQRQNPSQVFV